LFHFGNNSIAAPDESPPDGVDAWIHIGEDGAVNVFTGKVEVGTKHSYFFVADRGGGTDGALCHPLP
jgi:hypothetical protein